MRRYILFVVVLFLYSAISVPARNGESACSISSSKSEKALLVLGKAYRTVEAVTALLLAFSFLVYYCSLYLPAIIGICAVPDRGTLWVLMFSVRMPASNS